MTTEARVQAAATYLLNGQPAASDPDGLRVLAQVNYGHFTSMQVRDGRAPGLELHFARLRRGNAELFDAPLDEAQVRAWMAQAAAAQGGDCTLRVTLFARGFDHRQPLRALQPDVLVAATAPVVASDRPIRVRSAAFVRPFPHLKHVATFPLFQHRRLALQAGFDDALFVDGEGAGARVVEGTVWNIGFWDGRGITWPEGPALRGTSEWLLQSGLDALGCAQQVRPVALAEVGGFAAAFAVNANSLQRIAAIDQVEFGPSPELDALLASAAAQVRWEPLA
ncbi:aminotransferase class IV [Pseudoxanthomonas suwonensis 11-1]|uniref:Aminotransferase class IV n=1 Tax=Pseudoxanthomonas suwonensis (strain 11-1) TaxID=743721 RepID=E6WRP4_PSEUU|nr:aminotransferase class IV [Pseudoxanthomonas suwonensis 11-1]